MSREAYFRTGWSVDRSGRLWDSCPGSVRERPGDRVSMPVYSFFPPTFDEGSDRNGTTGVRRDGLLSRDPCKCLSRLTGTLTHPATNQEIRGKRGPSPSETQTGRGTTRESGSSLDREPRVRYKPRIDLLRLDSLFVLVASHTYPEPGPGVVSNHSLLLFTVYQ